MEMMRAQEGSNAQGKIYVCLYRINESAVAGGVRGWVYLVWRTVHQLEPRMSGRVARGAGAMASP